MELLGIASILGKLAMTEAAKAAVAGVKNQLHPDKMERILKNAIESAQAAQPETGGIFFRCQSKTTKEFLEQFFKSTEVVKFSNPQRLSRNYRSPYRMMVSRM
jgi:hypothetical protein